MTFFTARLNLLILFCSDSERVRPHISKIVFARNKQFGVTQRLSSDATLMFAHDSLCSRNFVPSMN